MLMISSPLSFSLSPSEGHLLTTQSLKKNPSWKWKAGWVGKGKGRGVGGAWRGGAHLRVCMWKARDRGRILISAESVPFEIYIAYVSVTRPWSKQTNRKDRTVFRLWVLDVSSDLVGEGSGGRLLSLHIASVLIQFELLLLYQVFCPQGWCLTNNGDTLRLNKCLRVEAQKPPLQPPLIKMKAFCFSVPNHCSKTTLKNHCSQSLIYIVVDFKIYNK